MAYKKTMHFKSIQSNGHSIKQQGVLIDSQLTHSNDIMAALLRLTGPIQFSRLVVRFTFDSKLKSGP